MLRATICNICINLLIGGYLAECFVLLTANVEDIKQIAKKFLSDSISDQITDFLTKAKTQDTISEENERNAQEERNSREIEVRQSPDYVAQNQEKFGFDLKPRLTLNNLQNREDQIDIAFSRPRNRDVNIVAGEALRPKGKNQKKTRYTNGNPDKVALAMNYGIQPNVNLFNNYAKPYYKNKIIRMKDDSVQMNNYGTTEKPKRNEFDQYDNFNKEFNIKNNYLATNGQLALKRIRPSA